MQKLLHEGNCKTVSKETYIDNLRRKETPRKMVNEHLVSPSRQCFTTPVGIGQGFLSKEKDDNT
jgi:hypothetical protein